MRSIRDYLIGKTMTSSRRQSPHQETAMQINLFPSFTVNSNPSYSTINRNYHVDSFDKNQRKVKLRRICEDSILRKSIDSQTTVEKAHNTYVKSKTISPKIRDYVNESVSSSYQDSVCQRELERIVRRYRKATQSQEPVKRHQYSSIEENLFECDKLISKLYQRGNKEKFIRPLSRKMHMRFHESRQATSSIQVPNDSLFPQQNQYYQQKLTNFQKFNRRSQSQELPQLFPSKRMKRQFAPIKQTEPPTQVPLERHCNISITPKFIESSIMQIRRQRVNQIISSKKEKLMGPVQVVRNKLRQRGENMFNKILRIKDGHQGSHAQYESLMRNHERQLLLK